MKTIVLVITLLNVSISFGADCPIGTWSYTFEGCRGPRTQKLTVKSNNSYTLTSTCTFCNTGETEPISWEGTWSISGNMVSFSVATITTATNTEHNQTWCSTKLPAWSGQVNQDGRSLLVNGAHYKGTSACVLIENNEQNAGDVKQSTQPTMDQREEKFYEGLEAGTQKYQEGKKRKDDLQDDFNSSKEIQDDHIQDRSSEAAQKANYDGSDDLEAMMNQEALNRLDASSGEFDEEPLEEVKKAELAGLLEEHEQWQAENGIGLLDPVRSVDDIFENDVFYEQGELRYFPCDKGSWEDEFYRSNAHRPSSIKHDDIVEDENLMHSLEEYVDDAKGFILEYFKPEASGGYAFYDRMNDQKDAIEKVKETKEDIETIQDQDDFFERLFSFDAESVEEWLEERKKMTDELMERFKFWNKLRGIEIKNRYEEEMPGLDHDEVVNGDCDDLDYNTTGYRHNNGEELKKIIGDDGGILDRFFYGL